MFNFQADVDDRAYSFYPHFFAILVLRSKFQPCIYVQVLTVTYWIIVVIKRWCVYQILHNSLISCVKHVCMITIQLTMQIY